MWKLLLNIFLRHRRFSTIQIYIIAAAVVAPGAAAAAEAAAAAAVPVAAAAGVCELVSQNFAPSRFPSRCPAQKESPHSYLWLPRNEGMHPCSSPHVVPNDMVAPIFAFHPFIPCQPQVSYIPSITPSFNLILHSFSISFSIVGVIFLNPKW